MKKIHLFFSFLTIIIELISSCANVSQPTGGPRDTIAPIRILSIPLDKSVNFKGETITMEYDERIQTDNIKEQLIITPFIESDYEYFIKKNTIRLTFEEPFQDSTTFTLNFRESIQDITEGNPTKDNKFTFSTGTYIDSMSINGFVKKLLTYDTLDNIVIGLYQAHDTITIFNGPPYYFTELQEDGSYLIENIKNGEYLLYAFLDENKNLELETNNELYGFIKDTIHLDTGLYTKNIDLISLDLTEFKKMTALASGKYFDINFNKFIVDYTITPINNTHSFYTCRAKENKSIRFYNNFENIDSLQIVFTAVDSINSILQDTLYVKFSESRRKKDEFKIELIPENNASIKTTFDVEIEFNKPILSTNNDSVFVQFDTTRIFNIHDSLYSWNKFRNKLNFSIEIDRSLADTVLARRERFEQQQKDSLAKAKEGNPQEKQQASTKKKDIPKANRGLQLYLGTGSFLSADMDTSLAMGYNYKFLVPAEYGIQEINITTEFDSFILQLTSEKFEIEREVVNEKNVIIDNLKPGNYKIRVLIDANNDGRWSPGNMIKQIEPEPVYIYPETIVIRADWRTSLDIAF